jgi:hypothetical protein
MFIIREIFLYFSLTFKGCVTMTSCMNDTVDENSHSSDFVLPKSMPYSMITMAAAKVSVTARNQAMYTK